MAMKRKSVFSETAKANTKARRKNKEDNNGHSGFRRDGNGNQDLLSLSLMSTPSGARESSPDIWSFERRPPAQLHLVLRDIAPLQGDGNHTPCRGKEVNKTSENAFSLTDPTASPVRRTPVRRSIFSVDRSQRKGGVQTRANWLQTPVKNRDARALEHIDINSPYSYPDFFDKTTSEKGAIRPSQRIDDDDEEDISILESSIVDETSPVKKVVQKRLSFNLNKLQVKAKPFPKDDVQLLDPPVESYNTQASALSQHISEDISSPSTASPRYRTPIAEWLKKDKNPSVDVEIKEFRSPSQDSKKALSSRRGEEMKSLLEKFKHIKGRYDTSARLFTQSLRNGKYKGAPPMNLIIRKVAENNDKLLKTIAYDLEERIDRFIVFRYDPKRNEKNEIVEGICIKLFRPWQEVFISATNERVIIGADFYTILRGSDIVLSTAQREEILEMPFPTYNLIKTSKPLFMDFVPNSLKSTKTIKKQLARFSTVIDVEVFILNIWNYSSMSLLLIKDSDDFLSFLQIAPANSLDSLTKGKLVKFSKVLVAGKVTTSENLSAFSILFSYGAQQTYFYMFRYDEGSDAVIDTSIHIPPNRINLDPVDIDDILHASATQDNRVSLKCQLKQRGDDYILVTDETDQSLKIQIVFDPVYDIQNVPCSPNSCFHLKFLRLIFGHTIWDHFTTCLEISDLDDEML